MFSDQCWISQVSDQILCDLKACIGLRLVEMLAEGRKGLNGGEIPERWFHRDSKPLGDCLERPSCLGHLHVGKPRLLPTDMPEQGIF